VGVHQRTDELAGLLTLRWKYSEYRQRHLLDRYAGLLEKCRVNREYALNTLARSLARGREELAYVSYLLFFHHLLMDLRSLLARRPMLSEDSKWFFERQLAGCAMETAAGAHAGIAAWLSEDLAAPSRPEQADSDGVDIPPAWPGHLDAVRMAVERFCAEFSPEVTAIVEASASHCHRHLAPERVPRLKRPDLETLHAALSCLTLRPCIDASTLAAIQTLWPDASGVVLIGPAMETEREALRAHLKAASEGPAIVTVAPHVEARADPSGVFREMDAGIRRLVACYQPPERFIPGLDAATSADLASAAAGAGWVIERFETLVGRTRLMLSR
jgi:hypothetical protein